MLAVRLSNPMPQFAEILSAERERLARSPPSTLKKNGTLKKAAQVRFADTVETFEIFADEDQPIAESMGKEGKNNFY
jgi:hypothetical protein